MKLTQIHVQGFLSIGEIHLKPQHPIVLVAGRNGASKSSIGDALKFAITRGEVRGISQKKEYHQLVKDGCKAGGGLVVFDNDVDNSFGFTVPKGDFTGPEISEAMRISLDGQRFAQMEPKDRAKFILSMSGKRMDPDAGADLLLQAGAQQEKVASIKPMLLGDWGKVAEFCRGEATKCKGAFRAISGLVWGPKQADGWKAPMPTMPTGDLVVLQQELADHDDATAKLNESLGIIKATQEQAAQTAARRSQLEASARNVQNLERQLADAVKERDEFQQQVEQMRQRAQGGKQGLVHDMARFIACQDIPSLGAAAEDEASALIARYEQEHGSIVQNAEPAGYVAERLPEHERGLQVLVNRAANLQRDLDAAKMAKGQYDALQPADDAIDNAKEITEITNLIEAARARRIVIANKVLDFDAAARGIAAAKEKTEQAAGHHKDVLAWQQIADLLSPEGIPAQLLAEALVPVNEKLAQAAVDTDWPQVVIDKDMGIAVGGRPYQLRSESEQWRADAMIAQAVAEVSGLKIVVLDRLDVLDIPSRGQLFAWMSTLAEFGALDTALLFGTLKALPTGMPPNFECHWVDSGAIAQQEETKAA